VLQPSIVIWLVWEWPWAVGTGEQTRAATVDDPVV
jgi:hypothetical protein